MTPRVPSSGACRPRWAPQIVASPQTVSAAATSGRSRRRRDGDHVAARTRTNPGQETATGAQNPRANAGSRTPPAATRNRPETSSVSMPTRTTSRLCLTCQSRKSASVSGLRYRNGPRSCAWSAPGSDVRARSCCCPPASAGTCSSTLGGPPSLLTAARSWSGAVACWILRGWVDPRVAGRVARGVQESGALASMVSWRDRHDRAGVVGVSPVGLHASRPLRDRGTPRTVGP